MREIKFRGKYLETGEWVYGDLLTHEGKSLNGVVIRDWGAKVQYYVQYYDIDSETVGQYTGLKDKNGREIYTDDIIRIGEMGGEAGRVIFDTACLAYMVVNEHQWTGAYRLGDFDGSDITIVGNIHENPELLEVVP